jgi:hypothetical protein
VLLPFVTVVPDIASQAAGQLESVGSALNAAHAAAAAPTAKIAAAAEDEVSAAIAALMNTSAEEYQALSAQAATFHSQFVGLLNAGAGGYASTEAVNVQAFTGHATSAASTVETPPEALLSEISSSGSLDLQKMAQLMAQLEQTASSSALSDAQRTAQLAAQLEQEQQIARQQADLAAQKAIISAAIAIGAGVIDVSQVGGAYATALHVPRLPDPVFVPIPKSWGV